ncbi:UNVERIFIED_ORG: hypothetical protein ABIB19_003710 [Arthrobacter sp. UYEF10]
MTVKKVAAFTPYYTEDQAGQVRAAFLAAGHLEGGTRGVSDLIVRASMREVKRVQRKYNGGKAWTPVQSGGAAPGSANQG